MNEDITRNTARDIIEYLLEHPDTKKRNLAAIKGRIGKKYGYKNVIRDSVVREYASEEELDEIGLILKRKKTRTLSGVTICAVMTKPYECPGECLMCPGPESQPGKKVAQSYTGKEPAALRSAMHNYDGYMQTFSRLKSLKEIGHVIDKIELIIMGGTFLHLPKDYQEEFMKGCFDAIINIGEPDFNNHERTPSLEVAKKKLETSKYRLIGVTFETRPDYCYEEHVNRILEFGATRIEIGIQSTRDDLLENINRKHTIEDNKKTIRTAKDAGLKVNAHMMPNLPGSSFDIDYEVFKILFDDPGFKPDMLKIYPCLVVKGTKLYDYYMEGKYQPYSEEKVIDLIRKVKVELIPQYAPIQRIQRDIPATLIVDGVRHGNLRQMIHKTFKETGEKCGCIRCREQGFYQHQEINYDTIKLLEYEYEASEGTEIFISYEDPDLDILFGYLRLRFPSKHVYRPEFTSEKTAIVREIRVVGEIVPHDVDPMDRQMQHRGYGKKLIKYAENLAKKKGCSKISIIAGIGVREYFYKLGYKLDGVYVSKPL